MADSHHVMVTTILMAVVVVGVAGLYFTLGSSSGPNVLYASGPTISGPGVYQPLSQSFAAVKPFRISAKGLTGLSSQRFGTASINLSATPDLRMPKNVIYCEAELLQDEDIATLYTCGDTADVGGSIVCDVGDVLGGPGDSQSDPTDAASCDGTNTPGIQANGAFVVCNHGAAGELNALVINATIGGVNSSNITFDNYLFNAIDNDANSGCISDCNECPNADTPGCFKDPLSVLYPNNVTECLYFDTSGQCVCECFSIHVTDEDDIHQLKNGETLEFIVKKTIVSTAFTSNADCAPEIVE